MPSLRVIVALLSFSSFANARLVMLSGELMATRVVVHVYSDDQDLARRSFASGLAKAKEIEKVATDYDPRSELRQLENAPIGEPQRLSFWLAPLIEQAFFFKALTAGAFDPTVGLQTRAWRSVKDTLPDPMPPKGGWLHATPHITRVRDSVGLDLGGIAKGYAVDTIFVEFANAGLTQLSVTIGGDTRLGDPPPDEESWQVEVRLSYDVKRTLPLRNLAISTSGSLHQKRVIDGVTYSHIIDPHTGLGMTNFTAAAIIASDSTTADALATAACVAPECIGNWPQIIASLVLNDDGAVKFSGL